MAGSICMDIQLISLKKKKKVFQYFGYMGSTKEVKHLISGMQLIPVSLLSWPIGLMALTIMAFYWPRQEQMR